MQGEKPQLLQNPVCVPAEARHEASGRVVPSPSGTAYPYIVCFLSLLVRGQKNSTTYFKIYARKHTEVCRETELASPEIQLPHSWLEVDDKLHTPSFQAHRVKNALNSYSPKWRATKSRRNVDTSGGDQVCSGTHFWCVDLRGCGALWYYCTHKVFLIPNSPILQLHVQNPFYGELLYWTTSFAFRRGRCSPQLLPRECEGQNYWLPLEKIFFLGKNTDIPDHWSRPGLRTGNPISTTYELLSTI